MYNKTSTEPLCVICPITFLNLKIFLRDGKLFEWVTFLSFVCKHWVLWNIGLLIYTVHSSASFVVPSCFPENKARIFFFRFDRYIDMNFQRLQKIIKTADSGFAITYSQLRSSFELNCFQKSLFYYYC